MNHDDVMFITPRLRTQVRTGAIQLSAGCRTQVRTGAIQLSAGCRTQCGVT